MPFENYDIILSKLPRDIKSLYLWGQGEPFIAPDFLKMSKRTAERGIRVYVSTNGHYLDDISGIIESGIYKLIVSLDGMTEEKYNFYRKGGDFNKVVNGVKNLADLKIIAGAGPIIEIQCLITKENAGDIDSFRKFAFSIGADKVVFKTLQAASMADGNDFLPDNPGLTRYERSGNSALSVKKRFFMSRNCLRIYYSAQIDWQGNVLPCCFDKNSEYIMGNLLISSFKDIWNSEKYVKFRKTIAEKGRIFPMCGDCSEGLKRMYF
jgi:radical SAM protein with 4Fe4S-binding SPASM domain